ncbi:MAG: UrcA family protein [Tsuneonella sp.]
MRTPIFILAAAAVTLAVPAAAETMSVKYDDLNLSTVKGQKELSVRLDKAARELCGMNDLRSGTRVANPDSRKCYAEAKASAKERFAAIMEGSQAGG